MNPRWAGFTAPFRWLLDAVDVGRHQPTIVVGAIIVTVLVGFLPSLPLQLLAMAGVTPGTITVVLANTLAFAVALLVSPVLKAGIYRIIDGAEHGRPVAVGDLLDGFRDGSWGRIVACALMGFALFVLVFVAMMLTMALVVGADSLQALQQWLEQVQALQAQAAASGGAIKPEAMPTPPAGLGGVVAVMFAFLPLWCVIALGTSWALVSVALRDARPAAAILDGLRAAFLNALPLIATLLLLAAPVFLLSMLVALVVLALVALASLLGPMVGGIVMLLVMLALTIVITAIGYAFVLNGWRAACDDGGVPGRDAPPIAGFEA